MQTLATPEKSKSASTAATQKNQQQPFFTPVQIQPKLNIGAADDPSEREAEAIAGKVMRMPVSQNGNTFFKSSDITSIQRKSKRSEEEEKLQRKSGNGESVTTAPAIVHEVLNSGNGRPLDHSTRSFMETRLNSDFSQVKIHDNSLAAKSADSINALAYTSGNNVVFNSGQYKTNTDSGKRLLAHELVHTMQQGGVRRKAGVIQRSWLGDAWDSVKDTASDIGHGVADAASAVGHGIADCCRNGCSWRFHCCQCCGWRRKKCCKYSFSWSEFRMECSNDLAWRCCYFGLVGHTIARKHCLVMAEQCRQPCLVRHQMVREYCV